MEKYQLERREKLAAGIVLAALTTVAIRAQKEGKLGHARSYPGGSFIIDVLKEGKEKSVRISGRLKSLNPLALEIDEAEHTDKDLDDIETTFEDKILPENPLQN